MLEHVFEPFFTTEARGTGLGLYLAREFCIANQAELRYERAGPGERHSSAFVILPRVAGAA
jgi:two-component system sensor histidine kinase PilS (NtrC family)